jgi:hypothetical protein
MFDLYCGAYPVWLCVGAPVIPGFFWSSLQLHTRRDILNQSFLLHPLSCNKTEECYPSFCVSQLPVYSTAFPTGWLGNIQKMFVCCTYSIGSPKVGDSPTWGTERVQFVRRKCFDKNSSDWETWFCIKANFFFFYVFFLPFCRNCIKNQNSASLTLKTLIITCEQTALVV